MTAPSQDAPDPAGPPPPGPGPGPMNDAEAAEFSRLVGGLAGAGLALPEGLRVLGEEVGSARVRSALARVADRVEAGDSLGKAIAAERDVPEHLVGIVRAAERSGRLAEVLAEAAHFERIGAELSWQVLLRLAYPTLLICLFVLIFQIFSALVTEGFQEIYSSFGVELSSLTFGLLNVSQFVSRAIWPAPVFILLASGGLWLLSRGVTRKARRRVASGIPLFGALWRNAALAEFSSLMALLIECRLSAPEALTLASRGVRDPDLIAACDGAALEVSNGQPLSEACRSYRLFPAGFDRLLSWAETHQALPDTFRLAAEAFASRARTQAALIGLFLSTSVVMIVVIGIVLMVLGLLLPILKLLAELSGGGPSVLW
ncbi:type II secretion system F family protein [Tautonia sociabilis]|uniref:Type II secretion system protein GspF domain-containing protein n=1 Tax=Tautonia sociabilis TaxID=2080755 RepID=A0A432MKX4_9BACT|nr:type II secretion system F family protein [Tautonia sociabilis]RUL88073.1 hypothetical protein TsocGM_09020 [Tautonia sociabilis]